MASRYHPNTAAKCNLNKCSPKMFAKAQAEGFPPFSVTAHFAEMTRSTFCLVPVGDSPPSSRLYLAVSAGCSASARRYSSSAPAPPNSETARHSQLELQGREVHK